MSKYKVIKLRYCLYLEIQSVSQGDVATSSNVAYHTYLKKGSQYIEVEPNVAYETVITNSCTQNENMYMESH